MSNTTEFKTSVFTGAAVPYAAFNLRDPYYREMAQLVVDAGADRGCYPEPDCALDVGCGIGISTMILAKRASIVVAVEPDESMRAMALLHFVGNRSVKIVEGRAEQLPRGDVSTNTFDLACACQMLHLLYAPTNSRLPQAFAGIANSLKRDGVFAFDLGPSNYEFELDLRDHRVQTVRPGSIPTEFCHPLYQQVERRVMWAAGKRFPSMDLPKTLWPSPAARMSRGMLESVATEAGFTNIKVQEVLVPLSTARVLELIRNGWAVFFRWGPLSQLPIEIKLELMAEAMDDFDDLSSYTVYHPTAVFTMIKE